MTRRDSWIPPVLTMATCGFYYFYWQYVTTEELKTATGREDLNPMTDLLLTICCCGLWGFYVQYRNVQVVQEAFAARNVRHEDKSSFVLIMFLLSAVNGITAFIAMMIVQDELNKLGDLLAQGGGYGAAPTVF